MNTYKNVGRPRLKVDKNLLEEELEKYINNEQTRSRNI